MGETLINVGFKIVALYHDDGNIIIVLDPSSTICEHFVYVWEHLVFHIYCLVLWVCQVYNYNYLGA
jgi:hypothetical protein